MYKIVSISEEKVIAEFSDLEDAKMFIKMKQKQKKKEYKKMERMFFWAGICS